MIDFYKHISFDLDGTLVHTAPEYRYAVVPQVVDDLGGVWTKETIDKFWFEANRSDTIQGGFELDPEIFWDQFRKMDTPELRMKSTFAYPECVAVLRRLKASGKTVSILTGAPRCLAEVEIALLGDVDIDHICPIGDSGFSDKPCPDSLHHALRTTGHLPHETLYVGNGAEDALFAQAAGCDFVLIDRGEHEVALIPDHCRISSLEELFI